MLPCYAHVNIEHASMLPGTGSIATRVRIAMHVYTRVGTRVRTYQYTCTRVHKCVCVHERTLCTRVLDHTVYWQYSKHSYKHMYIAGFSTRRISHYFRLLCTCTYTCTGVPVPVRPRVPGSSYRGILSYLALQYWTRYSILNTKNERTRTSERGETRVAARNKIQNMPTFLEAWKVCARCCRLPFSLSHFGAKVSDFRFPQHEVPTLRLLQ